MRIIFLFLFPILSYGQNLVFSAPSWYVRPQFAASIELPATVSNSQSSSITTLSPILRINVLPEDYNWRRDAIRIESNRRAGFGYQTFDCYGREMAFDVMREVNFRALYSKP